MDRIEFELDCATINQIPTTKDGILWTPENIVKYWLDFQQAWETQLLVEEEIRSRPMPQWFNEVWD